jgi:hypothetical protein
MKEIVEGPDEKPIAGDIEQARSRCYSEVRPFYIDTGEYSVEGWRTAPRCKANVCANTKEELEKFRAHLRKLGWVCEKWGHEEPPFTPPPVWSG